ncbi:MAG TPA: FHA domain-containing protein [Pyrinomonadaceae bacterium]|jgi:pSer/pThr/pTyr-binding forkhead associated (FHA) protein|nr:FHA domain-containing protein [Pyrinomonadaceae bacterium]
MNNFMTSISFGNRIVDSLTKSSVSDILPRLVAIEGPLSDQTIYLDEPVISIGRQSSNEICLDDPYVSRQHCLIRGEGEHYIIEDLNSANGTYVNSEQVKESLLKERSLIQIGSSRFLFCLQNSIELSASSRDRMESENRHSPLVEISLS